MYATRKTTERDRQGAQSTLAHVFAANAPEALRMSSRLSCLPPRSSQVRIQPPTPTQHSRFPPRMKQKKNHVFQKNSATHISLLRKSQAIDFSTPTPRGWLQPAAKAGHSFGRRHLPSRECTLALRDCKLRDKIRLVSRRCVLVSHQDSDFVNSKPRQQQQTSTHFGQVRSEQSAPCHATSPFGRR